MAGPAAKIEMWDAVEVKKNRVRVEEDVVRGGGKCPRRYGELWYALSVS